MNISRVSRFSLIAGLAAVVLSLTGCSIFPAPKADPTRYYVLTGAPLVDSSAKENTPTSAGLVLGLKRIDIVPYLNGKDMVVRDSGNEITYQNFARWAEPLTTSINRTLIGRLVSADKVSRVYAQPFPFDAERDYDVSIRVIRCEGEKTKDGKALASFAAVVEVTKAKTINASGVSSGGDVVLRKMFVAQPAEWDGKDYGQLATLLSDAVAAMSAEVIAALPAK